MGALGMRDPTPLSHGQGQALAPAPFHGNAVAMFGNARVGWVVAPTPIWGCKGPAVPISHLLGRIGFFGQESKDRILDRVHPLLAFPTPPSHGRPCPFPKRAFVYLSWWCCFLRHLFVFRCRSYLDPFSPEGVSGWNS